jgi:uncharacterized membrane protein YkvA (DUF1232 family)
MLWVLRWIPMLVNPNYWKKMWVELRLARRLLTDSRVPLPLKALPILIGLYLLSPLDLIPGFLPIVGQLDDFGLLMIGLSTFIRLAPKEVVSTYRAQLNPDPDA